MQGSGAKVCRVCGHSFDDPAMEFCPRDGAELCFPEELSDPRDPLLGRVVAGRYRVRELLGRGGMGSVYVADQLAMRREVALKVLRLDLARDPRLRERFEREARAATRVESHRIITLHDFGEDEEGLLYIAMERLRGQTLSEYLRKADRLEPAEALRIASEIARALEAAHAAGVIHRDLKPDNVMLVGDPDGEPGIKVLDFGIAKILEGAAPDGDGRVDLTQVGAIVGTPCYMSPEAVERKPVGRQADLYALGVILFEMLVGRPPFEDDEPVLLMGMHVRVPPELLRQAAPGLDISDEVEGLVSRLLAKSPEGRPRSAEDVAEALETARASHLAGGPGGPVPAAAIRPVRTSKALRVAAVGAVPVAALTLWGLFGGAPAGPEVPPKPSSGAGAVAATTAHAPPTQVDVGVASDAEEAGSGAEGQRTAATGVADAAVTERAVDGSPDESATRPPSTKRRARSERRRRQRRPAAANEGSATQPSSGPLPSIRGWE